MCVCVCVCVCVCAHTPAGVADSYIRISGGLVLLATIENTELNK